MQSELAEQGDRPAHTRLDGEVRRAIAAHRRASRLAGRRVSATSSRNSRHRSCEEMTMAMPVAPDLVPAAATRRAGAWMARRDPPGRRTSRAAALPATQAPLGVGDDALACRRAAAVVVPVLDVDAEAWRIPPVQRSSGARIGAKHRTIQAARVPGPR
jgi:hypothetical protein